MTLLQHYDLTQIITFIVLLALSARSVISSIDWAKERFDLAFSKEFNAINKREEIQKRLQHGSQFMHSLEENDKKTEQYLKHLERKIDMLIDSDKDAIKSYITQKHHFFCYEQEWIDDFSLDCIERRYQHYKEEGGNTFIDGFMGELRQLPKGSSQKDGGDEEELKGEKNVNNLK